LRILVCFPPTSFAPFFFFLGGGGILVPGGGANVGWWETVSDAGDPLHPINWRQMACARTGVVEERKVAKPI